ncbi:MAG TPA: hypothetical protein VFI25_00130 [Planctomycetota bacterium]|nr:hypothetical protein [Planctomycetota bacterium]
MQDAPSPEGILASRTQAGAAVLGLHLIDVDEPSRERPVPGVAPRTLPLPPRIRTGSPPGRDAAAPLPSADAPPSPAPSPSIDRSLFPSEYDRRPGPADTLERIGRGMARDEDARSNFAFLRLLDRFHLPAPDADDPLSLAAGEEDLEERTRFLHARAKGTVTARLRDAVDETDLVGPVVRGAEHLPQSGIDVLETVVEEVTGGAHETDLGELRFRARGGLMRSPSRMVSLHYSGGPLDADFFPTRAKVRIGRSIGGFRFALRGEVDYADPRPSGRVEVTRRVGSDWRIRVTAGTGVGSATIPLFTSWPGDGGDSDARRGVVAFFERRF